MGRGRGAGGRSLDGGAAGAGNAGNGSLAGGGKGGGSAGMPRPRLNDSKRQERIHKNPMKCCDTF